MSYWNVTFYLELIYQLYLWNIYIILNFTKNTKCSIFDMWCYKSFFLLFIYLFIYIHISIWVDHLSFWCSCWLLLPLICIIAPAILAEWSLFCPMQHWSPVSIDLFGWVLYDWEVRPLPWACSIDSRLCWDLDWLLAMVTTVCHCS